MQIKYDIKIVTDIDDGQAIPIAIAPVEPCQSPREKE
jgi:hypothetical protein